MIFAAISSNLINFNSIKVRLKLNSSSVIPSNLSNFNSIKVRLKQESYYWLSRKSRFQFHKGTIKTPCFADGVIAPIRNFNSIKVRLKQEFLVAYQEENTDFNSIKVRLKPPYPPCFLWACCQFQFHKGTIKTFVCFATDVIAPQFQFHKGTIKTRWGIWCFVDFWRFQFHKGTIKTAVADDSNVPVVISIP